MSPAADVLMARPTGTLNWIVVPDTPSPNPTKVPPAHCVMVHALKKPAVRDGVGVPDLDIAAPGLVVGDGEMVDVGDNVGVSEGLLVGVRDADELHVGEAPTDKVAVGEAVGVCVGDATHASLRIVFDPPSATKTIDEPDACETAMPVADVNEDA